jgi:hypothetical protein
MGRLRFGRGAVDPREQLCLARIKSAFKMNNRQRGRVTCYKEVIQLTRPFGGYKIRDLNHPPENAVSVMGLLTQLIVCP